MGTTNERTTERAAKAERRDRPADVYEPHFPAKRQEAHEDRTAVFDPHFPTSRRQ